jgi:hypothetical protein
VMVDSDLGYRLFLFLFRAMHVALSDDVTCGLEFKGRFLQRALLFVTCAPLS